MNPEKLLAKVRNNPRDVRFSDFVRLVEAFGFEPDRTLGSHRIFEHPAVPDNLVVQPRKDGKAKPYQVRQLLDAVAKYGLTLED